jgi:hypothetical protein
MIHVLHLFHHFSDFSYVSAPRSNQIDWSLGGPRPAASLPGVVPAAAATAAPPLGPKGLVQRDADADADVAGPGGAL